MDLRDRLGAKRLAQQFDHRSGRHGSTLTWVADS